VENFCLANRSLTGHGLSYTSFISAVSYRKQRWPSNSILPNVFGSSLVLVSSTSLLFIMIKPFCRCYYCPFLFSVLGSDSPVIGNQGCNTGIVGKHGEIFKKIKTTAVVLQGLVNTLW